MSDVESFVRFCESDFGTTVMDCEAAYLKQFVDENDIILDIGAGIGSIEERFPDEYIIGFDVSPEMIRKARSRVEAPFIVGDARTLPVVDNRVDVIFSIATLEFIPEVERVLQEITRVLRPDGIMIALLLNTASQYVQTRLDRDSSYFERMVHRDTLELAAIIENYMAVHREYILGIQGHTVVDSSEPSEAALLAVSGSPQIESRPYNTGHIQS